MAPCEDATQALTLAQCAGHGQTRTMVLAC